MEPEPAPKPKALREAARDLVTVVRSSVVIFVDTENKTFRPLTGLQAFKELEQASELPE